MWLPVFSPFPTMFSKGFSLRSLKVRILWLGVTFLDDVNENNSLHSS